MSIAMGVRPGDPQANNVEGRGDPARTDLLRGLDDPVPVA